MVEALPWPSEKRVTERLLMGRLQRIFMKPWVFSISLFPVLWVSALIDANPDVFFWEKIRSLQPLPEQYTERFPNVQAAIGLEALEASRPVDRPGAGQRAPTSTARSPAFPGSSCRSRPRIARTSTTSTA